MRRDESTTPDDLQRPDGNDLQSNYQLHDIAEAALVERLTVLGFDVVPWGIDMRDDGGDEGIIYDDKMDFKIVDDGDLVALVDVKSKSGPKYMGRFNERHYVHYHQHARNFDVPAFVAMFQTDYMSEDIYDEFVFEIDGDSSAFERVLSSSGGGVAKFPDGNAAVLVPHAHRLSWSDFEQKLMYEQS